MSLNISISIREAKIDTKTGVSRRTGKPYSISEQAGFVTLPNGETRRITLQHEEGDAPLQPGDYVPLASAVWVGDFGALSISTRAKHWAHAGAVKATAKAA